MQLDMQKAGRLIGSLALLLGVLGVTGFSVRLENIPDIRSQLFLLQATPPPGYVAVLTVVDGDTLVVRQNGREETVRLLGIDTPETKDPRKSVQCYGKAASAYTKSLLQGRFVRLESDPTQTDRDMYDRLLRYVYFDDGSTLNDRLVYEGYAFAYEKYPSSRLVIAKKLEDDARANKRGLWGSCQVTIKNDGKNKYTQNDP